MIGILAVSHSAEAAVGIARIASEMAGESVPVKGVGGSADGGLGISAADVHTALSGMLAECAGVVVVPDIGSSILSSRTVIGLLSEEDAGRVAIAYGPILEGTLLGAIEASAGSDLEAVCSAAADAKNLDKSGQ